MKRIRFPLKGTQHDSRKHRIWSKQNYQNINVTKRKMRTRTDAALNAKQIAWKYAARGNSRDENTSTWWLRTSRTAYGENRWCLPLGDRRLTEPLCQQNAPHPSLRPPDLSQFNRKILSPLSLYKNTGFNTIQSGGVCEVCSAWSFAVASRAARAFSSEWGGGLSEQPAGREPAGPPPAVTSTARDGGN